MSRADYASFRNGELVRGHVVRGHWIDLENAAIHPFPQHERCGPISITLAARGWNGQLQPQDVMRAFTQQATLQVIIHRIVRGGQHLPDVRDRP